MISADSSFGIEGYLAMLIGQRVPHRKPHQPTAKEQQRWRAHLHQTAATAATGLTIAETLAQIGQPGWRW